MPEENRGPGAATIRPEAEQVLINEAHDNEPARLGQIVDDGGRENQYAVLEIDAIAALGLPLKFVHPELRTALLNCDAEHRVAPRELLDRLYGAATPDAIGGALVHVARVAFQRGKFQFDVGGFWAVVIPIFDGPWMVDLAAFDPDDAERRAVLLGHHFCVGLPGAQFDARLHPDNLITVHHDVMSFLRAQCVGALPVDWHETAVHLAKWRIPGVIANPASAAQRIYRLLRLPPITVRPACST